MPDSTEQRIAKMEELRASFTATKAKLLAELDALRSFTAFVTAQIEFLDYAQDCLSDSIGKLCRSPEMQKRYDAEDDCALRQAANRVPLSAR